jgi:hypothetical protein
MMQFSGVSHLQILYQADWQDFTISISSTGMDETMEKKKDLQYFGNGVMKRLDAGRLYGRQTDERRLPFESAYREVHSRKGPSAIRNGLNFNEEISFQN